MIFFEGFCEVLRFCFSGKTGIRTLGTVARSPHFECGPIDHSGIFPSAKVLLFLNMASSMSLFFRKR